MAKPADMTPELLRQLLRYEPETGKLFWKIRTFQNHKKDPNFFNKKYATKEALAIIPFGQVA